MSHRDEIEDLIARYTHAYDLDRLDDMFGIFTDDAQMTMRIADGDLIGPFEGPAAIVQMMKEAHSGQTDRRRHVSSNLAVALTGDDTATAISYLTLLAVDAAELKMLSVGTYEDELVRQDGKWLFAKRHIALDLPY